MVEHLPSECKALFLLQHQKKKGKRKRKPNSIYFILTGFPLFVVWLAWVVSRKTVSLVHVTLSDLGAEVWVSTSWLKNAVRHLALVALDSKDSTRPCSLALVISELAVWGLIVLTSLAHIHPFLSPFPTLLFRSTPSPFSTLYPFLSHASS